MKGKILDYSEAGRKGVIAGEDGNRYDFDMAEWKPNTLPRVGNSVDFAIDGNKATSVYAVSLLAGGASKKVGAALFAFFLGAFGAHKFYLGYTAQGITMLLVFLFGFILLGIPSIIIGLIAFVEFILYLTKSDQEFQEIYVDGRKPWF